MNAAHQLQRWRWLAHIHTVGGPYLLWLGQCATMETELHLEKAQSSHLSEQQYSSLGPQPACSAQRQHRTSQEQDERYWCDCKVLWVSLHHCCSRQQSHKRAKKQEMMMVGLQGAVGICLSLCVAAVLGTSHECEIHTYAFAGWFCAFARDPPSCSLVRPPAPVSGCLLFLRQSELLTKSLVVCCQWTAQ